MFPKVLAMMFALFNAGCALMVFLDHRANKRAKPWEYYTFAAKLPDYLGIILFGGNALILLFSVYGFRPY